MKILPVCSVCGSSLEFKEIHCNVFGDVCMKMLPCTACVRSEVCTHIDCEAQRKVLRTIATVIKTSVADCQRMAKQALRKE